MGTNRRVYTRADRQWCVLALKGARPRNQIGVKTETSHGFRSLPSVCVCVRAAVLLYSTVHAILSDDDRLTFCVALHSS